MLTGQHNPAQGLEGPHHHEVIDPDQQQLMGQHGRRHGDQRRLGSGVASVGRLHFTDPSEDGAATRDTPPSSTAVDPLRAVLLPTNSVLTVLGLIAYASSTTLTVVERLLVVELTPAGLGCSPPPASQRVGVEIRRRAERPTRLKRTLQVVMRPLHQALGSHRRLHPIPMIGIYVCE